MVSFFIPLSNPVRYVTVTHHSVIEEALIFLRWGTIGFKSFSNALTEGVEEELLYRFTMS